MACSKCKSCENLTHHIWSAKNYVMDVPSCRWHEDTSKGCKLYKPLKGEKI